MKIEQSARYALDGHTPIRHVVTALGGAGDRPLSLEELAITYNHSVVTDLTRIRLHENCAHDDAAKVWLMRYAISKLGPRQVEEVDGQGYRLKKPPEKIRYNGKPIALEIKETPQFFGGSKPFDPMSGFFSDNIRATEEDELKELRESMREFGWVRHFPAIRDERGVVLVGHRRLKIAAELGIEPVYLDLHLGAGSVADIERLKIALVSNIGFKAMTKASRQRIAEYLYGPEHDWSMAKIAEALRVSVKTISVDLQDSRFTLRKTSRKDFLGRNNPGRPRNLTEAQAAEVIDRHFNQGEKLIDITRDILNPQAVRNSRAVENIIAIEHGRREGLAKPQAPQSTTPARAEHEHVWICQICGVAHGN